MPDSRTIPLPAASPRELDAQCRGLGGSSATRDEPGMGRGRAMRSGAPIETPIPRTVVVEPDRTADGPERGRLARRAVTTAATEALTQDAAERAAEGPATPLGEVPTTELARLLERLRTEVGSYVHGRRAAGAPVERILPEVKAMVREAAARECWYDPAETLMARLVGWTIAAYYDEPRTTGVADGAR